MGNKPQTHVILQQLFTSKCSSVRLTS